MTAPTTAAASGGDQLLQPDWATVLAVQPEANGVASYQLRFQDPSLDSSFRFAAGQFNMLYLPGYGEAAISISSDPGEIAGLTHTIRFVGSVTDAFGRLTPGSTVGVRGPFGRGWPLEQARGANVVLAAGGIGMAPLRPAVYHILRQRQEYGRVILLYGARTPEDLLFIEEIAAWEQHGIEPMITVDRADDQWQGSVGVLPMLFYRLRIDAGNTFIFSCGPEIMMRFVVFEALARRVPSDHIYLSLERNMKCGLGLCGRCQHGPYFVCRDGPVFRFDAIEPYFQVEDF
ncbi:MAG: FAD/NAD(P)-binding protein [Anaerolineales bacterium]